MSYTFVSFPVAIRTQSLFAEADVTNVMADGGATFMTHIAEMLETFLKTFDLQVLMKNIVANLVLVNVMLGL